MRRPRPALLVLLASAIALIAGVFWLSVAGAPMDEGSVGQRPPAVALPEAFSSSGSVAASSSPEVVRDALGIGIVQPQRVSIPAIKVNTNVVPVGLDENRGVAIPANIDIVGWWELGVAPGADRGSAVLVAHRDGVTQGRGVFYSLGALDVGDRVNVTDKAGRTLEYRVAAREYIRRKALPMEELFAIDGPPRLTLISCGGAYVKSQGGYQDNIVITATPA